MMNKILLAGLFFATAFTTTQAFSADEDKPLSNSPKKTLNSFTKEFGGGNYDEGKAIINTPDGGFLLAGQSIGVSGNFDLSLWKVDNNGNLQWDYKFGDSETEEVSKLIAVKDGYIAVGSSDSYGAGSDIKDMWVIKVDLNGKQVWSHTYGTGESIDEGKSITPAHDGGFLVAGRSFSIIDEDPKSNVFIVKTDDKGQVEWEKKFGGASNDEAVDVLMNDDGYMVVSNTESKGKGKWDIALTHLNKEGEVVWSETYGGGDTDQANNFITTEDGGYIITGYSYTFAEASTDCWVVRTDAKGKMKWHKSFGGLSTDESFSIVQTQDKNYVIAGYAEVWEPDEYGYNVSIEGHNVFLVKLDDNGNKLWERSLGGEGEQRAFGMVESKDGELAIVGSVKNKGQNNFSILLMKVSSTGM